ncbi:hypothetical protein DXG03_000759 [Asterophora parasitica]|uniref:Mediator complex subunit 16 C-terminal domain-containing protein n=1 Tax=Asterophora parasitica TaxID=117018 RepID=A0A9P7GCS5_9AGAR|nr:hypothetical protein DXG03_000759 [Asterophora parasitica]
MSPQKGNSKERQKWQTGWWDFQPLTERSLKPVEWSTSSVIFSAHSAQPLVTARHFSSSKQFIIPSPTPILTSPGSYGPPTAISVAPGDDWLFAFFPGRNVGGIGCLWKRGSQIDSWSVKEWWTLPPGDGVVAASWLGTARERVVGNTPDSSTRLPPRGPRTPMSSPMLLLVTQDHLVKIHYFRHYVPNMLVLSRSIAQPGATIEGSPQAGGDAITGIRQCFRAAIGLGYNESSILIATRSYYIPPPLIHDPQFTSLNPEELGQPLAADIQAMEWESWGEEATINLCELTIKYNGANIGFVVDVLPPIPCGSSLAKLQFISIPPPLIDVQNPPSSPRKANNEKPLFYLVSSYLDFDDYTSPPKSELLVHSIARQLQPSSSSPKPTWKINKTATRSFTPSVVTFFSNATIRSSRDSSHLTDNEDYEPSPILCEAGRMGQDSPLDAVLSPNGALLCTISSSLWPVRTSVQSLPRLKDPKDSSGNPLYPLAVPLASAVISGRPATDITRALALASTPIPDVLNTLYQANLILDGHNKAGFSHTWTLDLLGEIMAIYKERALDATDGEKENLTMRWRTAHNICSLAACNKAFEDCHDGENYDLDAVWQLIGLATWIVSFAEQMLKECVLSIDLTLGDGEDKASVLDLQNPTPPLKTPILLLLGHPFPLNILFTALSHVQKYRAYVGSLSARGENSQIARDVLIDLVDSSGINFAALKAALVPTDEMKAIDRDSCRRALVSCQPDQSMYLHLSKVIQKVTQPSVLNRPLLFIKPRDLVDGVTRLASAPKKDTDKDVVSKRALAGTMGSMTCVRCEGETTLAHDLVVGGTISPRWRAWEKNWAHHCICGGSWMST